MADCPVLARQITVSSGQSPGSGASWTGAKGGRGWSAGSAAVESRSGHCAGAPCQPGRSFAARFGSIRLGGVRAEHFTNVSGPKDDEACRRIIGRQAEIVRRQPVMETDAVNLDPLLPPIDAIGMR